MKPAAQVLAYLRTSPSDTTKTWGFVLRGDLLRTPIGGACSLACATLDTVYTITPSAGGTDWYIPFGQGQARYCDVPSGQPNGTLIVTYPMNGCALEVHATDGGSRLFHDSDGKSMTGGGKAKFRVEYEHMAGLYDSARESLERVRGRKHHAGGNFEHTIFCVREGGRWMVYQTAVVTARYFNPENDEQWTHVWQVKDRLPNLLGSFTD